MPTTSDYLTQLQQDREDLVDNLEAKGITGLTGDETFTELVPKVLDIEGGGGGGTSRLPAEYQEVEYIESTGTQYINSGVLPNTFTTLVLSFAYTSNTTNTQLFGSRESWNRKGFYVGTKSNTLGNGFWIEFGSSYYETNLPLSDTNQHTLSFGRRFYYDDTLYYTFNTTLSGYQNIILFGSWEGEQNAIVPSSSRLYSCQIYDNITLIRDFAPCYRKSDNVIGLYDLVNNTFYTNSGSGTFTKGNDVTS